MRAAHECRAPLLRRAFILTLLTGLVLFNRETASSAYAASSAPRDAVAADALAATPSSQDRDKALIEWSRKAPLRELLWLLRRDDLGGVEAPLVEEALRGVPASRAPLRQRLLLRLALADPKRGAPRLRELAPRGELPARPRASVFRLAVLAPEAGGYDEAGRALLDGVRLGLGSTGATLPVEVVARGIGDERAAHAVAALDSASFTSGILVGGVQGHAAATLAAAARVLGLPLVSPVATAEELGEAGPAVFPLGPSGAQRGRVLARAVVTGATRVAIATARRESGGGFADGFAGAAESLGARVVHRVELGAGADVRAAARALRAASPDLLFWDGDGREAESLLRALAGDTLPPLPPPAPRGRRAPPPPPRPAPARPPFPVVGGSDLDPERFHEGARHLLEGARFVDDEWRLEGATSARLDSLAGGDGADRYHARGWLAGRLVALSLASGALGPEELADALRARLASGWPAGEATLPLFTVAGGRAAPGR